MKTDNSPVSIYVINLRRNPERRLFMENQLNALGLEFEILEATNGLSYDFPDDSMKSLNLGEMGCAHSHRSAQQRFLTGHTGWALIMEDDIEVETSFPSVVEEISKRLDPKNDIFIQFDYAPVGIKGVVLWWFLFSNLIRNNNRSWLFWLKFPVYILKGIVANLLSLYEGVRNWYFVSNNIGTVTRVYKDRYLAGCYLLSRTTAHKLIELNTPIRYTADAVHNIARQRRIIQHYIAIPRMVRQKREIFNSTLNNEHFGKKIIAY